PVGGALLGVPVEGARAAEGAPGRRRVRRVEGPRRQRGLGSPRVRAVLPVDVELSAHPEPGVLVRDDRRARRAERVVPAGVLEVPVRVEEDLDGLARIALGEEAGQLGGGRGSAAVDEREPFLRLEHDDVAARTLDEREPAAERQRRKASGRRLSMQRPRHRPAETECGREPGAAEAAVKEPALSATYHKKLLLPARRLTTHRVNSTPPGVPKYSGLAGGPHPMGAAPSESGWGAGVAVPDACAHRRARATRGKNILPLGRGHPWPLTVPRARL